MGIGIFNQFNLHIPITPLLLFSLGALLFAVWAVFSIIAHYHWKSYGTNQLEIIKMTLIYFVGSAILLAAVAIFAFAYSLVAN